MALIKRNLVISCVLASLLFLNFAQASSSVSMSINDEESAENGLSWLSLSEAAGGMAKGSIKLRNQSTDIQNVLLYAADATSNEVGSFILKSNEESQKGIGQWTTLAQKEISLNPGQEKAVDFFIRVPKEIPPGQYFGGIIKEEISENECASNSGSCAGNIQIRTRVGNRIYLTVPGQAEGNINMTAASYSFGKNSTVNFKFRIENRGNVGFEPKAVIDIYDFFGNKIETVERSLGKSLPNTITEPEITWKFSNRFGIYSAKARVTFLEVDYGQNNNLLHASADFATAKYRLFLIPWILTLLLGGVLLFLISYFSYDNIRFMQMKKLCANYFVKDSESLEDIARDNGIKWRMLARINTLKAPYSLRSGQKIKLPQKSVKKHK